MRRLHVVAFAIFFAAAAPVAHADVITAPIQVLGSVTNAARPVANALVIALNLKDLASIQTYSTADGHFALPALPAGVYKIIAVKAGFAPAVATVAPNKASQTVTLALENDKRLRKSKLDEIWELRATLPQEILHEIDLVTDPPVTASRTYSVPRFRGEMVSLTGVSDQPQTGTLAQTSVGVESRIGESWQLGFRGNLHRIENPIENEGFSTPAAESSVMSVELRSSPNDSYRVASSKSSWRYTDATPGDGQADVRSHNFEWEHGGARVGVRYFAQDNLFASNPLGSDLFEITGGTTLLQTGRNDIGVSLRVTQENVRNSTAPAVRSADVNATGAVTVADPLVLHYGISSRVGLDGTEVAPRTGADWKIGKQTSIVASVLYKVFDPSRENSPLPMVVMLSGDDRVLPRYSYSLGIVSGDESSTRLSAIASVTAVESPLRVVLNDAYEQFWDGFFIDSGDVRRDVRVAFRQDFGRLVALDVSTSAGTATPTHGLARSAKSYVTGDLQSIFLPTGTTLLVSYRGIQQPQDGIRDYRSRRVNVRIAQPLHLPLDLKVLLGIDMARAENSPFLVDTLDASANASRKYIGGLAMAF